MEVVIIGIVTMFNLVVLKVKYEKGRYGDLLLDVGAIFVLNSFFGGTLTGMMIAMIASFGISIYLYFKPPKFFPDEPEESTDTLNSKPTKSSLEDLNLT